MLTDIYDALEQIERLLEKERHNFNLATRRRLRAADALAAAETDMHRISGSMVSLELMHRIISGTEALIEKAEELKKEESRHVTLAG